MLGSRRAVVRLGAERGQAGLGIASTVGLGFHCNEWTAGTALPCPTLATLGAGAFGEAGDRGGFGIVDVEDGEQLGDLQHFLELAAKVAEAERGALTFGAVMRGDEGAETRAVDKGDVVHVEDDFLFALGEESLYFFTQRVALFSQNDAAVQCHHGHAIHFAVRHLQCHVRILLK